MKVRGREKNSKLCKIEVKCNKKNRMQCACNVKLYFKIILEFEQEIKKLSLKRSCSHFSEEKISEMAALVRVTDVRLLENPARFVLFPPCKFD